MLPVLGSPSLSPRLSLRFYLRVVQLRLYRRAILFTLESVFAGHELPWGLASEAFVVRVVRAFWMFCALFGALPFEAVSLRACTVPWVRRLSVLFSGDVFLCFDEFTFLDVLVHVWPFYRAAAGYFLIRVVDVERDEGC